MRAVRNGKTKPISQDVKRAAVELWKAKVALKTIWSQLGISKRALYRILAHDHDREDGRPLLPAGPGPEHA